MRLLYIAFARIPTEKAHGLQIVKTCEAFMRHGVEVELLVPKRANTIREDAFSYYSLTERFPVATIRVPNTTRLRTYGFLAGALWFAFASVPRIRAGGYDIIYTRDESVAFILTLLGYSNVVWESHTGAWNLFARHIVRRVKRLIVITQGLKDFYVQRNVSAERITVAHDAVDLATFEHTESKGEARRRLGLSPRRNIVMYVGRLDSWKGSSTLLEASRHLPADTDLVVIGGKEGDVPRLRSLYPHVAALGNRPYRELPDNLAAADLCVLPNTGKDVISARFTSPLKLFAYMAAEKPIISSDLPSIREVLGDDSCFWFRADNALSLSERISYVLAHPHEAAEKARAAHNKVLSCTWDKRARVILAALDGDDSPVFRGV